MKPETELKFLQVYALVDPIRICDAYGTLTELLVPVLWGLGMVLAPVVLAVTLVCALCASI